MPKLHLPGQAPDPSDADATDLGLALAAALAGPPAPRPHGPPPPPPPPAHHPEPPPHAGIVTTNAALADGSDNVITDRALGFDHVISYSLDGTGNNRADSTAGAAGADEARLVPAHFAAGSADTPVDGPNARVVSNTLLAGGADAHDAGGRSAYLYSFGQFVDHDIDLNPSQTRTAGNVLHITVPADDAVFTPGTSIDITRGQVDPANGDAVNAITSYLDLSQVYGSDATTAASLRNADGSLITSAGGNLPVVQGQFMGGDVRAAENPDLTSIDVLFVREHNYWVGQLHAQDASLTGDQLYDMARAITTAEYQHIVYDEFLPSLLGPDALPDYKGYDPTVTAHIFEEFSTAAYRFGHTIVSDDETKIANDGTVLAAADLIAASFEPTSAFGADGGADALLRNMAQDASRAEGLNIVGDLLNMADPSGRIADLGAIDIERERDLGIATLNGAREALGLHAYGSFAELTSDAALAGKLQALYGTIDQVDLFVGGLAEAAAPGAMVGPTFQAIIAAQFANLRDGDRLFYENQHFTPALYAQIESTSLSDLITRDTDTVVMQADAFTATIRHASDVASSDPTAPQLVIGIDADNAVITGEAGVVNTLVAGAGANQTLIGSGSSDSFVFLGTGHHDSVVGFRAGIDHLAFERVTSAVDESDVTIRPDEGGTLVQVAGNSILLVGIDARSVSLHDIQLSPDNPALYG